MIGRSLHTLLVEDDRLLQLVIEKSLRQLGFDVTIACDGVEALAVMKNTSFDFVLMDIRMPGQDGLDTTRWIRDMESRAQQPRTPIFALTTYDSSEHTEEILAAGMNEHLIKPFRPEALLSILAKYFPRAQ